MVSHQPTAKFPLRIPSMDTSSSGATPTNLNHPLSTEPTSGSSRSRRSRARQGSDASRTASGYFTLKSQLQPDDTTLTNGATWDGSVRGLGSRNTERLRGRDRDVSVSSIWDRSTSRQAPVIVVEQPDSSHHLDTAKLPRKGIPFQLHKEYLGLDKEATSEVLTTRWHRQSDQAIQSTISKLDFHDSSSDAARHPYHATLRILSSALSNMRKACKALEDDRALLQEKEAARKERADQLLRELPPSERDIAKRIVQSLFPDDDEHVHQIQRRQSNMVGPIPFYLIVGHVDRPFHSPLRYHYQKPSLMRCRTQRVSLKKMSLPPLRRTWFLTTGRAPSNPHPINRIPLSLILPHSEMTLHL